MSTTSDGQGLFWEMSLMRAHFTSEDLVQRQDAKAGNLRTPRKNRIRFLCSFLGVLPWRPWRLGGHILLLRGRGGGLLGGAEEPGVGPGDAVGDVLVGAEVDFERQPAHA